MSFAFAFDFKLTDKGKQARYQANGEEYRARVICGRIYEDKKLELTWNHPSVFIVVGEIYFDLNNLLSTEANTVVNSTKCFLLFESRRFINYGRTYTCVIKIIPTVLYEFPPACTRKPVSKVNTLKQIEMPVVVKKLKELSADFKNLCTNGDFCDVILKVDSVEIRAHKAILSCRSSVFAKMFQTKMRESIENCVTICDTSPEVMKEFLAFVYTGVASITDRTIARELYMVSHKYDVEELKYICSFVLMGVTMDDVIDILSMSDLYDDIFLKSSSLHFISDNYSSLKSHSSWEKLMICNQKLAVEVLNFIIEKKTNSWTVEREGLFKHYSLSSTL